MVDGGIDVVGAGIGEGGGGGGGGGGPLLVVLVVLVVVPTAVGWSLCRHPAARQQLLPPP